jgi:acetamidase/formamidase
MDVRQLTAGSTLYLPIAVDGGLFSIGDAHALQGDGEVCSRNPTRHLIDWLQQNADLTREDAYALVTVLDLRAGG